MQDQQTGGDLGAPAFPSHWLLPRRWVDTYPGQSCARAACHDSRTPTPAAGGGCRHTAGACTFVHSGMAFADATSPRQTGALWVAQGWVQGPFDPSLSQCNTSSTWVLHRAQGSSDPAKRHRSCVKDTSDRGIAGLGPASHTSE